jgi:hypothetical protein
MALDILNRVERERSLQKTHDENLQLRQVSLV